MSNEIICDNFNITKSNNIKALRVLAMIFILSCHIVQENLNNYIQMTAQFLNVGVSIFIIISGYLYGDKKINERYSKWVVKRLKRIMLPMYVFMIYLLVINLIKSNSINLKAWIMYLFNLQGVQIYIHGAEHLWYLTIIMICYLITPLLNKYKHNIKNKLIIPICLLGLIIQIVLTYNINTQLGIYLTYIYLYIVSYWISYKQNKKISKNQLIIVSMMGVFSIVGRLIGKILLDDTIIYNVFIVGYTEALIGLSIASIFIYNVDKIHAYKVINYLEWVSYEMYIVHYMYIVGPVRCMGLTNSFIFNTIITLTISFITAIILRIICAFINKILIKVN